MVAFCYYLGTKKIKTIKTEKTRQKKKKTETKLCLVMMYKIK
jgi:hypothetical protein